VPIGEMGTPRMPATIVTLLLTCFNIASGEKSLNVFGTLFVICCDAPSQ